MDLTFPLFIIRVLTKKKETLQILEGFVDVYLPDLKYAYNSLAKDLSGIDQYFERATRSHSRNVQTSWKSYI